MSETPFRSFPAGAEASAPAAGDFVLTHRPGMIPALISFAERRRFGAEGHWSHAALVVDGDGALIEAETRGVIASPLSKYRESEYVLVATGRLLGPDGAAAAVGYARAQLGRAFGFLVLASLGAWLVTGRRVRLQREDHQICSSLVARALAEGGLSVGDDPTFMLPAELAIRFGAPIQPPRPVAL